MKIRLSSLMAFAVLTATVVSAQQTYISSLSQPLNVAQTFGSIGHGYDFTTDNQSYSLSSIALTVRTLKDAVNFRGSIFETTDAGLPTGTALATVFSVADFNFMNPHPEYGLKVVGFEFSGVNLAANTRYSFVAGASDDLAYEIWGSTNLGFSRPGGGEWDISPIGYNFYGSDWHPSTVEYIPALAIAAVGKSAVPEPSTYGVMGCIAILGMLVVRRRKA